MQAEATLPKTPLGYLPPKMKVLFITGKNRTGRWLAEALGSDSATEVLLDEVQGVPAGLSRLRDEVFDAVLISHEPHNLDALEFLEVLKTGSSEEQPIIVMGDQSEQQMAALSFEVGADAYICVNSTTTRTLIWQVARAVQRHAVLTENRHLLQQQRQKMLREKDEARRQLVQQRAMLDLPTGEAEDAPLPGRLVEHYRELLKAHIIMGAGNLHEEMRQLVDLLVLAKSTSREAMRLHLAGLEEVLHGLGNRSARHVMNRADLLITQVLLLLSERYRRLYLENVAPQHQMLLPGFEVPAA